MNEQSIESALILHLKEWPDIAALIESRIYPDYVPQPIAGDAALPAIAVSVDGDEAHESLDSPAVLYMAEFEVNCWADTKLQAETLRRAVRDCLNGFVGTLGEYSNVKIEGLSAQRSVFVSVGQTVRRAHMGAVTGVIWFTQDAPYQLNTTTG